MFPSSAFNFKPEYVSQSAWHKHMPFAYHLICELNPKIFVELGVHRGDSYFSFCQSCKENKLSAVCYGVDSWEGDAHAGIYGKEVFEQVYFHNTSNYSNFSYLIKSSFEEASQQFEDNSIQLLHIDGLHTYDAVKSDFETWFPKVEDQGFVLLHDIRERKNGFGVWRLWEQLKEEYPCFLFDYGSGLGVLQKAKYSDVLRISDDLILDSKETILIQQTYLKAFEFMDLKMTLASKEIQFNQITSDFNRISKQHQISNDKIKSMQSSFSWKITSPLRALRRMFFEPFRKGREIHFDPVAYLELNPDLASIYGGDLKAATQHYHKIGVKQGRRFRNRRRKSYREWVKSYDTISEKELHQFRLRDSRLSNRPLISIIMPVFNTPVSFLEAAIGSVIDQIYQNWELCIVNDASTLDHVSEMLDEYATKNFRIKVEENETNKHISASSNRAIQMATGDFLAFMDHDDLLRPHSLLRVVEAINENSETEIVYSDEDKVDQTGMRTQPYFKPDWNPDLLFSQNYMCHLLVIKKKLVLEVGGFREGFEGSQDWDLALRVCDITSPRKIFHVPEILYHWRIHDASVSSGIIAKDYAIDAARKALEDCVKRNELDGKVRVVQQQYLRLERKIIHSVKWPKASIVISFKDNALHLQRCLQSLREKTRFKEFEVILVDNGSTDPAIIEILELEHNRSNQRVLSCGEALSFSAASNFAASEARGECLVFLDACLEILEGNWLGELLSHSLRKEIGAVGAKLLYSDGAIWHAGLLIGYCELIGDIYRGFPADYPGQMQRANLIQNISAVSGACLAIEKSKFTEVCGFDEKNLHYSFIDADFCLRLQECGYRNLFTPYATLIRNELSPCEYEDRSSFAGTTSDAAYFKKKWCKYIRSDPAYNPNLSLNKDEQFEPSFPPRWI